MALEQKLITRIEADTTNFTKGIDTAQKKAQSFAKGLNSQLGNLKGAFIALGAGTAIAGLKSAFDQIDKIGYTASKLDITTQSLQKLQYVATRTDVDFSSIEGGLEKLRKKLGEATSGSKSAQKAFSDLGLNANDLAKGDLGEAYFKVGEGIRDVTSSTNQATAAINIFGKNGQAQLNALRSNMKGLSKEAEDLGFILSDADIERFNGLDAAVDKLAFTLKGNLFKALTDLAPLLTTTANGVSATTSAMSKAFSSTSSGIADFFEYVDNIQARSRNAILGTALPFNPTAANTAQDFNNRNKFANVDNNASNTNTANAAASISGATSSILSLGNAALKASANLSALGTTKLQDLLGINQVSGASYLKSILPEKQQFTDTQFTALATQLRDNIENGSTNGGISNNAILQALKDRAKLSDQTKESDQSNSGIKNAVKELEDAMRGISADSKVRIEVKVDEQGLIKALASSDSAKIIFENTLRASVTAEAAVAAAARG